MFSQPAHLHEQIHRTDLPLWHQLETIAQSSDSRAIISAKYELPEPKTHTHTHTHVSPLWDAANATSICRISNLIICHCQCNAAAFWPLPMPMAERMRISVQKPGCRMAGWLDGRNWNQTWARRRMTGRWANSNRTETLPRLRIKIMQTRNKDEWAVGGWVVGGAVVGAMGGAAPFNRQMWPCHLLPKSARPKRSTSWRGLTTLLDLATNLMHRAPCCCLCHSLWIFSFNFSFGFSSGFWPTAVAQFAGWGFRFWGIHLLLPYCHLPLGFMQQIIGII